MVPGSPGAISTIEEAAPIVKEIGFPLLIKASAGGGGKGMRIVHSEDDLNEQLSRAMSEAENAFGDSSVFIERYVTSPRHIEFQILADKHGHVIHILERECSVQRRHQKVVEEAPSSILTKELRQKMGEAAVNVARSCNYVERAPSNFYWTKTEILLFEMNTRLQVEHPVTEMITGLDLVEWQN